jgi:hypothetical protein
MGKRAECAPIHCAGVLATACTQGRRWQHGKPDGVVGRDDQPEAGDGQRGRYGVAERPVLLKKPGNAGGGKGPWFKTGAESSEAQEIGATLYNSGNVRKLWKASHAEAKKGPGYMIREANVRPGGGIGGCAQNARLLHTGEHGPELWIG